MKHRTISEYFFCVLTVLGLHWGVQAFSSCVHGLLLPWSTGSRAHRLSSHSMRASLVAVCWLSCPESYGLSSLIESEALALEGGLLTTGLPGKPLGTFLFAHFHPSVPGQLLAYVFRWSLGRGAFGTLAQAGKVPAPASSFLS